MTYQQPNTAEAAMAEVLLLTYGLLGGQPGSVSTPLSEAIDEQRQRARQVLEHLAELGWELRESPPDV